MIKKQFIRWSALFLIFILIAAGLPVFASDYENRVTEMQNEIQRSSEEKQLQKESALELCKELSRQVEVLDKEIAEYQKDINAKYEEISKLEEEYASNKLKQVKHYDSIKQHFTNLEETKDDRLFARIFGKEGGVRKLLNSYLNLCAVIQQEEEKLFEESLEIKDLKDPFDEKREQLQDLIDEQEALVSRLEAEIGANDEQIIRLREQLDEYNRRKEEAAALLANAGLARLTGVIEGNGLLSNPCPNYRCICSDFGEREDGFHKGTDLKCDMGDPVVAAADGTVMISGYSASAGNWILIDHGNDIITKYMHCSELYVSVGDHVSRGELIAAAGTTGDSSTVHLHFQVEVKGEVVNPWSYL